MVARQYVITVLVSVAIMSCASGAGAGRDGNQANSNSANGAAGTAVPQSVKDILASNSPGRAYKCTVCHGEYLDPKILGQIKVRQSIVDSILSARMPLEGDRMLPKDLEILRAWAGR